MKRAVHVLRKLDPGGIEYWLLDLARRGGVPGFSTEVLLETMEAGALEPEFRRVGVRIHRWTLGNFRKLRKILEGCTVVHSHVHAFSGAILVVAAAGGVPVRIAHSHTCAASRSPYRTVMRGLIRRFATRRLAVSRMAAISLFGHAENVGVVPCARELAEVQEAPITGGQILVGHVGRLVPEKNHRLLLDLLDQDERFHLLLCGSGPTKNRIAAHARVQFAATAAEVYARAHCFVFPSIREGLGMALIEAQAAGLTCVVSDRIPPEAHVISDLIRIVGVHAPLGEWSAAVEDAARRPRVKEARDRVLASPYAIEPNIRLLEAVYAGS